MIRSVIILGVSVVAPVGLIAAGAQPVSTEQVVVPLGVALGAAATLLGLFIGLFKLFHVALKKLVEDNKEMVRDVRTFAVQLSSDNKEAIGKLSDRVNDLGNTLQQLQVQLAKDSVPKDDVDKLWAKNRSMEKTLTRMEEQLNILSTVVDITAAPTSGRLRILDDLNDD